MTDIWYPVPRSQPCSNVFPQKKDIEKNKKKKITNTNAYQDKLIKRYSKRNFSAAKA